MVNNTSEELTGGSVNYYRAVVTSPTSPDIKPYVAECNDIIEVLEMTPAMANIFKAIWRMAASLQGKRKKNLTLVYDAEKTKFFSERLIIWARKLEKKESLTSAAPSGILASPLVQEGIENCLRTEVCSFPKCSCPNPRTCS